MSNIARLALIATLTAGTLTPAFAQEIKPIGYMGVSDIQQVITLGGNIVNQFDPSVNADTIRVVLGFTLGDAKLTGFAKDMGAVAYFIDDQKAVVFMEVNSDQIQRYATAFKKEKFKADIIDGMLAVCVPQGANLLSDAKALAPLAKSYLAQSAPTQVELHLDVQTVGDKFQKNLAELAQDSGTTPSVAMSLSKQLKTLDAKLSLTANTIAADCTVTPMPDTAMAKAIAGQTDQADNDLLKRLPNENAVARYIGRVNYGALAPLFDEFGTLMPTLSASIFKNATDAYTGKFAGVSSWNANGTTSVFSVQEMKSAESAAQAKTVIDEFHKFSSDDAATTDAVITTDDNLIFSVNDSTSVDRKQFAQGTAASQPIPLNTVGTSKVVFAIDWNLDKLVKSLVEEASNRFTTDEEKTEVKKLVTTDFAKFPNITAYVRTDGNNLQGNVSIPVNALGALVKLLPNLAEKQMNAKAAEEVVVEEDETTDTE